MAHVNLTVEHTFLDVGLATGAPNVYPLSAGSSEDNTAWLHGSGDAYSAGTAGYPGSLTPFAANNAQGTNAVPSQVRLISLRCKCTDEDATTTFDINAYDTELNYILSVVSAWNDTDADEGVISQAAGTNVAFTINWEAGTITLDVATDNDIVHLTVIAA